MENQHPEEPIAEEQVAQQPAAETAGGEAVATSPEYRGFAGKLDRFSASERWGRISGLKFLRALRRS